MTQTQLRPNGRPVPLQDIGFAILSSTMDASITTYPGSTPGTRSGGAGLTSSVLQSADVREIGTVVLQDNHPEREQEKHISLFVPSGYEEDGRLLIYFDEDGGVSIHTPQGERTPPEGVRASGEQTLRFDVPIRKPSSQSKAVAPVRGVGGIIAKKVLKVIGWKVLGMAARRVGPPLVRLWEDHYRPLRVLDRETLFLPGATPSIEKIPPANKSLLFIHGTFSRVAAAFSGLPEDEQFLSTLHAQYADNIFGFDHATLATGVATNVMQLYDRLSPGVHNFDIISHSRGGLVARALRDMNESQLKERFLLDAERGKYSDDLEAWGKQWRKPDNVEVNVSRIVFAGTPNNGTVLAQPNHLKKYLEIMMTATNLLPEVVDVTVDAILATAKVLVSDLLPNLPGLDDQHPKNTLIPILKDKPGESDAAIQADYEPPEGLQAMMRIADTSMDFIFGDETNDLVVPTEGVSKWPNGGFVTERLLTFNKEKGIFHSNMFKQLDTRIHLLSWLA